MADNAKKISTPVTFEAAMERLENIVGKMESAQMPLDELLMSYEEGTQLIAVCQQKLAVAEQRIEMVTRKTSETLPSTRNTPPSPISPSTTDSDVSLF